jgi:predicted nucleotidyltransferase
MLKKTDMKERRMEVVDEVIKRCKATLGENVVSIVLFGSLAHGLEDKRSDIDILLVVNEDISDDFLKDIRMDILLIYSINLDIICMNKQDVIDNFEHFSPLFLSFVLGISILVDTGFFKREYDTFLHRLKGEPITYVERGKIWDLQEISSGILQ